MGPLAAEVFVQGWLQSWNDHDLEAILAHFTEDVVFSSPMAVQLADGDGTVRGKPALREYWDRGLQRIPNLRFELVGTYVGVQTLVVNYRNQAGGLVNEVLKFSGDLVYEGHGTYLDAGLGGLRP
jgi:hypothetical protein